jgi:hypothetical protein
MCALRTIFVWALLVITLELSHPTSSGQEPTQVTPITPTVTDSGSDAPLVLTKEIAEQFMANPDAVKLDGFSSITLDAAEVLADCDDYLDLGSLTNLPDEVAKRLGQSTCAISLNGLKELSEELAIALSENRGGFLDLKGLTKISDKAAVAIAKFKGNYLYLGGVTSMSDELAEELALYRGTMIELSNLHELSESAAAKFCKIHANVSLPSLKVISVPVAESLSKLTDRLDLGLESISEGAAAALAENESLLVLTHLRELKDREAAELAKHRGPLLLYDLNSLPNTPGHLDLARKLSEDQSDRMFTRITELSDEVAEVLGEEAGDLGFKRLPSLSPRAAKAFAQKRRTLLLFGVTSLSDEAAEELAKGKNRDIALIAITELSDRAAMAFADFKGDLDLRGITKMSENAAHALKSRTGKTHFNLNILPESVREILAR